jgi:hypothetical protein
MHKELHMRRITVLAAALLSAACIRTATNEATGAVDVDIESPTKQGEDWKGSLTGQAGYTNLSGGMQALVAEGRTTVNVVLNGASPGARYIWHIHEGKCGTAGVMVGDAYAYPPLVIGDDGKGAVNAMLQARLDEAKDYYVDVHASPSDMATIVACGDLDD